MFKSYNENTFDVPTSFIKCTHQYPVPFYFRVHGMIALCLLKLRYSNFDLLWLMKYIISSSGICAIYWWKIFKAKFEILYQSFPLAESASMKWSLCHLDSLIRMLRVIPTDDHQGTWSLRDNWALVFKDWDFVAVCPSITYPTQTQISLGLSFGSPL